MKRLTFILTVLIYSSFIGWTQSNPESFKLQEEAHKHLAAGQHEQAIMLFTQAVRADPQEVSLRRDLAYAHFVSGNITEARKTITPVLNSSRADEQTYQIAAAIESKDGKTKKAARIFKEGLEEFPHSALLYHQQGLLNAFMKNENAAIESWENGIKANRNYTMNYYNLALIQAEKGNHVEAIFNGEIFLNLDIHNPRANEVRKMILDAYQAVLVEDDPNTLPAFDSKTPTKTTDALDQFYKQIILQNGSVIRRGFDMETVIMLRTRILLNWKHEYMTAFNIPLLHYHDDLIKNGYFEAYHYWLFGAYMNSQEFAIWKQMNAERFSNFESWISKNSYSF